MKARYLSLFAAAIFLGCQQEEREHSTEITLTDVPAAARSSLERETGGARITRIEREDEGGRPVYEAEYEKDGKTWSVEVDENGKVLENEQEDDEDRD